MAKTVLDERATGFGMIQPGAGEAREIMRSGSKVEKGYLGSRMKVGGHAEENAVRAIQNIRRRNVSGSALSPSSIRDE